MDSSNSHPHLGAMKVSLHGETVKKVAGPAESTSSQSFELARKQSKVNL